jgi:hypothetical protein
MDDYAIEQRSLWVKTPEKPPRGSNCEMDDPEVKEKFDRFTQDLGRSGLVMSLDDTLRAFHAWPPGKQNSSDAITNLGGWLIGQDVLTYWQYTNLSNGQWRGFFLDGYKLLGHLATGKEHSYYLAEETATGLRVALRITPMARSKVPGVTEYVVVSEFT